MRSEPFFFASSSRWAVYRSTCAMRAASRSMKFYMMVCSWGSRLRRLRGSSMMCSVPELSPTAIMVETLLTGKNSIDEMGWELMVETMLGSWLRSRKPQTSITPSCLAM